MSWQIHVPSRGHDQPLDVEAVSELPRALEDPEDRAVTRHVLLQAMFDGRETLGDVIDSLKNATQAEQRQMLDEAREASGLEKTVSIDARRDNEMRSRGLVHLPMREMDGSTFATCAAAGCFAGPLDPLTGTPRPTRARRWHCPAHEHLAAPGDMDDWTPGIRYSASGAIEYTDEVERERQHALLQEERTRARNAQRDTERQAGAEERKRHAKAVAEHYRPKSPAWDPTP